MGNLAIVVFFVLLGLGVIFALADVHPSSTTEPMNSAKIVDFDRPEYQDKEEPWSSGS